MEHVCKTFTYLLSDVSSILDMLPSDLSPTRTSTVKKITDPSRCGLLNARSRLKIGLDQEGGNCSKDVREWATGEQGVQQQGRSGASV